MPPKKGQASKLKQRARMTESANKTLPVVIKSEPIFSKDTAQTAPYGWAVIVCSAFHIKDDLKHAVLKFHWGGSGWVTVTRTKKTYDLAFSIVAAAAEEHKLALDDQRTSWLPTNIHIVLDLFEDFAGVPCVSICGHTFVHRELLKHHSGKFHKPANTWECNPTILKSLIPLILDEGVPIYGNFNHDNSWTDVLTRSGYKKAAVPEDMGLDDDAEAWSYVK